MTIVFIYLVCGDLGAIQERKEHWLFMRLSTAGQAMTNTREDWKQYDQRTTTTTTRTVIIVAARPRQPCVGGPGSVARPRSNPCR